MVWVLTKHGTCPIKERGGHNRKKKRCGEGKPLEILSVRKVPLIGGALKEEKKGCTMKTWGGRSSGKKKEKGGGLSKWVPVSNGTQIGNIGKSPNNLYMEVRGGEVKWRSNKNTKGTGGYSWAVRSSVFCQKMLERVHPTKVEEERKGHGTAMHAA